VQELGGSRTRSVSLDVLKALAIVGVIAQHAIPQGDLASVAASVWVRQAVTVFVVLMGFNAARSIMRRGDAPLRELADRDYWVGRLWRLGVPVLVFAVVSTAVGLARGGIVLGPTVLAGQLPYTGPGNYFVTLVLTFAVVFPLLFVLFRARPVATVIGCFAVAIAFEAAASQVSTFRDAQAPFLYIAALPRYLGAVAVGMWLASDPHPLHRRNLWIWIGAPVGLVYLGWLDAARPDFTSVGPAFLATAAPAACWAGLIVALGLLVPVGPRAARALAPVALVGQASFHIFLVQMLVFRLTPGPGAGTFLAALAISCVIGVAFYRVLPAGPPARRASG
jgi:peptidoglycan/LPS O-acetylase OafA/YrhL